jgi:hypothetical protein
VPLSEKEIKTLRARALARVHAQQCVLPDITCLTRLKTSRTTRLIHRRGVIEVSMKREVFIFGGADESYPLFGFICILVFLQYFLERLSSGLSS